MKHRVSELSGALLDAAVAKAFGLRYETYSTDGDFAAGVFTDSGEWAPSTSWQQGGPIIETESLAIVRIEYSDGSLHEWSSAPSLGFADDSLHYGADPKPTSYGQTPLIAAMRACVASKYGDEVELP